MAFMTLYYRLCERREPGVGGVHGGRCWRIFKIGIPGSGPVTLTLAGIAAFVLSVGIAVDANILIFERTKEELRNGRSLDSGWGLARVDVDPRQQHLNADHVRHPVLDGQRSRRA